MIEGREFTDISLITDAIYIADAIPKVSIRCDTDIIDIGDILLCFPIC